MYKVYFNDNTVFTGGEINDSKWNDMPEKPIIRLEYNIIGNKVLLYGYEAYNHLVERVQSPQFGSKTTKLILMVKKGKDVLKLVFDVLKRQVYSDIAVFGEEYNKKPATGWKKGIISNDFNIKID